MTPEQKGALYQLYYASFKREDPITTRCLHCAAQASIPWRVQHDDDCPVETIRAMLWTKPRESYPNYEVETVEVDA